MTWVGLCFSNSASVALRSLLGKEVVAAVGMRQRRANLAALIARYD
jgi:hypothetical protein